MLKFFVIVSVVLLPRGAAAFSCPETPPEPLEPVVVEGRIVRVERHDRPKQEVLCGGTCVTVSGMDWMSEADPATLTIAVDKVLRGDVGDELRTIGYVAPGKEFPVGTKSTFAFQRNEDGFLFAPRCGGVRGTAGLEAARPELGLLGDSAAADLSLEAAGRIDAVLSRITDTERRRAMWARMVGSGRAPSALIAPSDTRILVGDRQVGGIDAASPLRMQMFHGVVLDGTGPNEVLMEPGPWTRTPDFEDGGERARTGGGSAQPVSQALLDVARSMSGGWSSAWPRREDGIFVLAGTTSGGLDFGSSVFASFMAKGAFEDADFGGSSFRDGTFGSSSFFSRHPSNLRNASFRDATFARTRFVGTDVSGADFTGARFEDVEWLGVIYDCRTRFPKDFDPVSEGLVTWSACDGSTKRTEPMVMVCDEACASWLARDPERTVFRLDNNYAWGRGRTSYRYDDLPGTGGGGSAVLSVPRGTRLASVGAESCTMEADYQPYDAFDPETPQHLMDRMLCLKTADDGRYDPSQSLREEGRRGPPEPSPWRGVVGPCILLAVVVLLRSLAGRTT